MYKIKIFFEKNFYLPSVSQYYVTIKFVKYFFVVLWKTYLNLCNIKYVHVLFKKINAYYLLNFLLWEIVEANYNIKTVCT